MVEEVKNNMDKIVALCKQMQVKSLYLFGSAARKNGYSHLSDLDFLIRFINGRDGLPIGGFDYFDLMFKLEEITGKKVDLVAEDRIRNKYFLEQIEREKIRIYEA